MGKRRNVWLAPILLSLAGGCADSETQAGAGGQGGDQPVGGTAGGGAGGEGGAGGQGPGPGGEGGVGGTSAVCGDGVLGGLETCDDGNAGAGDGCDETCALESGYTCPTPNQPCTLLAGSCDEPRPLVLDAVVGALVGSFDGDTTGGDDHVAAAGCDGRVLGTGADAIHTFTLSETSDVTVRVAFGTGDGLVRVLTAPCDASARVPGEVAYGDACANTEGAAETETLTLLGVPPGTYYVVVDGHAGDEGAYALDLRAVVSTCENGVLDDVEECDDGNAIPGDGCTRCVLDRAFVCDFEPSVCTTTCQDGVVDADLLEECDDGNATDGDRCDASCRLEHTVLEAEPNDTLMEAQPIADGDIVLAAIDPATELDVYELTLSTAGFVLLETYETIDGNPDNGQNEHGALSPLVDCTAGSDTDLYLFDASGDVLDTSDALFSDDGDGAGSCAFLGSNAEEILLPAGTYYVRVDEFAGGSIDRYVLDVRVEAPRYENDSCDPALDFCDPTAALRCDAISMTCQNFCGNGVVDENEECDDGDADDDDRCNTSCALVADVIDNGDNDTFATAQPLAPGQVARGSLDTSDVYDIYSFTLSVPSWVTLEQYTTVDADPGNYDGEGNDELDCPSAKLDLDLYDVTGDPDNPSGTALLWGYIDGDGDCGYLGPNVDGQALFFDAGTYYVQTTDASSPAGAVDTYLVDLQVYTPLDLGQPCDPTFDLCNPTHDSYCGPSNTCSPRPADRTNYEDFRFDFSFDLQNTRLTFTPTGGTYDVVATSAAGFADPPGTGTVSSSTPALLDDAVFVAPLAFSFPFYGVGYTNAHVFSNGFITFAPADPLILPSPLAHFAAPRVSWFFDDLAPNNGGTVTVDEFADRLTVTFDQVPPFFGGGVVEAQVQLFTTGVVTITHLSTTHLDGVVGLSAGDALGLLPDEIDFSAQVLRPAGPGDLVINEFLANPSGADSNCDTTADPGEDELVEIVNVSGVPIDLIGVTVSDATGVRYTFGAVTLGAGRAIVVYGGGASLCPSVNGVVAAGLDLDDGGDTITLSTGDAVTYGATTPGISATREPELIGAFTPHDAALGSAGNLSPGFRFTGASF